MADGLPQRPGKIARYDALTGGKNGRRTYYAIARRLRVLPSQFDAEPWWSQRLLLDGLIEEADEEARASKKAGRKSAGSAPVSKVDAHGDLSNSPFRVQSV